MPAPRKYSEELCERVVRMVFRIRREAGQRQGAVAKVAAQLGVDRETLRNWVRQAEVDDGLRPGTSTADAQRFAELERELWETRRVNEILKAAASFFARELDPRLPRWSSSSASTGTSSVGSSRPAGCCRSPHPLTTRPRAGRRRRGRCATSGWSGRSCGSTPRT